MSALLGRSVASAFVRCLVHYCVISPGINEVFVTLGPAGNTLHRNRLHAAIYTRPSFLGGKNSRKCAVETRNKNSVLLILKNQHRNPQQEFYSRESTLALHCVDLGCALSVREGRKLQKASYLSCRVKKARSGVLAQRQVYSAFCTSSAQETVLSAVVSLVNFLACARLYLSQLSSGPASVGRTCCSVANFRRTVCVYCSTDEPSTNDNLPRTSTSVKPTVAYVESTNKPS